MAVLVEKLFVLANRLRKIFKRFLACFFELRLNHHPGSFSEKIGSETRGDCHDLSSCREDEIRENALDIVDRYYLPLRAILPSDPPRRDLADPRLTLADVPFRIA